MGVPFVIGQVSTLQPISCHSRSSMSVVREGAASEMCRFNSSMSLGKRGTYSESLLCPHKNKSHGGKPGHLRGHLMKGQSA